LEIVLTDAEKREWDGYLKRSPHATIYHQANWRDIFEDFFGHNTYYLMAKENGDIKGVLPLALMKSKIFGNFMVSLPFHCVGGVCADNEKTEAHLINVAIRITKEEDLDYLELRNVRKKENGLETKNHKASFVLDLSPGPDELWQNFKKQIRNRIRKSEKHGLSAKFGHQYINEFYECYATHMRDLGLPIHDLSFFKKVLNIFLESSQIAVITQKGKVVAAKFFMFYKNTAYLIWGASLKEEREYMSNYLLTWEVIKYVANLGYKYCDFGRSTVNTGPFYFKQNWGGQLKPLYWQYYLNNGNKMPDLSPFNSKYRFAIRIWKRFPLAFTKLIGPEIVKHIP